MKEAPRSHSARKLLRGEIRDYEARLTSNPPDEINLINKIYLSLIKTEQGEIDLGTTKDSTHIKAHDWHTKAQHPRNTGVIAIVSYRAPESIIINGYPFFTDFEVSSINRMIESGDIKDRRHKRIRNTLEYRSTKIPPHQEGENGSSPIILCLGELRFRREEAKKAQA